MRNYPIVLSCCFAFAATAAFAGNFQIDQSQSELAADMHASPSHDFTSVAKHYEADISIHPETLEVEQARCRFRFADLDSGKRSRDSKMCKWMEVEKHPEAEFVLQEHLPDNETGEHVARGTFRMHGQEQPLTITYTLQREGEDIIMDGHCSLDHTNWNLPQVRLLFFSVDTLLKPHFHLVGTLQKEDA